MKKRRTPNYILEELYVAGDEDEGIKDL